MDFDFTEEQLAVSEAAAAIFEGMAGTDRVAEVEATEDRFDDRPVVRAGQGEPARTGGPRGARRLGTGPDRAVPRPRAAGPGRGAGPAVGHRRPRRPPPGPLRHRPAAGPLAPGGGGRRGPAVGRAQRGGRQRPATTRRCAPSATARAGGSTGPPSPFPRRMSPPACSSPRRSTAQRDEWRRSWRWSTPPPRARTLERATTTDHQIHPHLHLDGTPVGAADVVAGPERGRGVCGVDARPGPDRDCAPSSSA